MVKRVVMADDHPVVLRGLAELISRDPRFEVVATAADGLAAVDAIARLVPDVAILDVAMPEMNGIEVISTMRSRGLPTKFILLTASADESQIYEGKSAGASGILLKDTPVDLIADVVDKIVQGHEWFAVDEIEAMIAQEGERRAKWQKLTARLTRREMEIVDHVRQGFANKEIGYLIGISEGTVKIHLNNIFRKLGVSSRREISKLSG